jgi:hypothetical protein
MRNFGQIRLSLSNFGQFRLSLGNFGQFRLSLSNFGQFRLYLNTCSNDNFRNFLSLKTCVTVDNLGSKFNINVFIILMNCKDSHAGIIAGVIVIISIAALSITRGRQSHLFFFLFLIMIYSSNGTF